jgi:hypothetical protein
MYIAVEVQSLGKVLPELTLYQHGLNTWQLIQTSLMLMGTMAYVPQPNNVNELFQTGAVFENSISANGGDANSSVALTMSNLYHKGYVENTSYTKNNIGLGGQTKV